jgi:hypothetical protein
VLLAVGRCADGWRERQDLRGRPRSQFYIMRPPVSKLLEQRASAIFRPCGINSMLERMIASRQVTFGRSCYRCEGVGPECKSEDDARRKRLSINWWLASRRKRTKKITHENCQMRPSERDAYLRCINIFHRIVLLMRRRATTKSHVK